MTSTDPGPAFSLTYELQPDDLQDLFTERSGRKWRRARLAYATVIWALLDAVLTAVTIVLDLPSVVKNSSGAPSWMYVVDAVIWFFVAYCGIIVWRLSPKRLTRRAWRRNTHLHGRYHDEVCPDNISCTAPSGTQIIIPLANIDHIRETENAFHLINNRGTTLTILPKRGLPSPDLIPALREFLNRSVNEQLSPPPGTDPGVSAAPVS